MAEKKEENMSQVASDIFDVTNSALIPGQIDIDPERVRRRWSAALLDDAPRPTRWTAALVGERLIEAARTVARMPMRTRPAGHSTIWPSYQDMTPKERIALLNELTQIGQLQQFYATQNRVSIPPSGEQIDRADEALAWPMRYLRDDPGTAAIVTAWAGDVYQQSEEIPEPVLPGLSQIAQGLDRDRVRVR